MRYVLTLAAIFSLFTSQAFAAASLVPAFSTFSSAGMKVNAGKQGTNTMQVIGATFSKPSGKPTMTILTAAEEVAGASVAAPGDDSLFGFFDSTFKKVSWANMKSAINGPTRYYVDYVAGNDTSNGITPATAFKTISRLLTETIQPNTVIHLARGSHWREELKDLSGKTITVQAYGSGKMPVLDASDYLVNAECTKSGGYTNLYQISWSHSLTTGDSAVSLWENGVRLIRATSIANADSTPGSFYVAAVSTGVPSTVYIHATGSTNVITNGYNFEITRRGRGLWMGDNATVYGVHTRNNGSNNGSLQVGKGSCVKNCLFEDGGKHNAFISSGLMEDCVAWKNEIFAAAGNSTMYVTFDNAGGLSTTFRRCKAIGSSTVLGGGNVGGTVGFYGHTANNADPYVSITYEDCETLNLYQGIGGVANEIVIKGGKGRRVTTHIMAVALVRETITDYYADGSDNTVPLNNVLAGVSPTTIISGVKAWVKDPNAALIWQDGDLSVEHSTLILGDGTSTGDSIIKLGSGTVSKWNNNIAVGGYKVMDLAAGVTIEESKNNVYNSQAWFQVGASLYTSIALLRAAYPAIEANSVLADPLFASDPRQGHFELEATSPAFALQAGADLVTDFPALYDHYGRQ